MAKPGEELVNPFTGERIVFLKTGGQTGGRLLEMDDLWPRPGHRTPEHVHPEMEERWEILVGLACFRIDGVQRILGPGETIVAPPGSLHVAWNAGEGPVRLRIQMRPALRWETFVQRLFALPPAATPERTDGATVAPERIDGATAMPDPVAALALIGEFPREIALPRFGAQEMRAPSD